MESSTSIASYSTRDFQPYKGRSYYRLKQTDNDGGFSYSEVVSVQIEPGKDVQVYPNPATEELFIEASKEELETCIFYNNLGQEMNHLIRIKQINDTKLHIDISQLPSVIYHIKTRSAVSRMLKR